MKKLATILVVSAMAGLANATVFLEENFDGAEWTGISTVTGRNGWEYWTGGTAGSQRMQIDGGGRLDTDGASSNTAANAGQAGVKKDHPDITSGTVVAYWEGRLKGGDSSYLNLMLVGPTGESGDNIAATARTTAFEVTLRKDTTNTGSTIMYSSLPWSPVDVGWYANRITYDMAEQTADFFIRDLDEATGAFIGDWLFVDNFSNLDEDADAASPDFPIDKLHFQMLFGPSGNVIDNISLTTGQGTPNTAVWTFDRSGNWLQSSNWLGAVPNDNSKTAVFGAVITRSRLVYTEDPVTVQRIEFANSNRYVIGGTAAISLDSGTGAPRATVDVSLGSHEFQAPVDLITETDVTVASGSTLTFNNELNLMGRTLTKTGVGTLAINNNLPTAGGTLNCSEGTCSGTGTIGGDLNNDGGTISPGALSPGANVVPEPGSLVLILFGMTGLLVGLSRRDP